jgi:NTE family protein
MTIRALILSGGGGRGAFHAGVFKYLSETQKSGVDAVHQGAWMPDIVVGTSIGAVNGAAITQGMSAAALEDFWLNTYEHHIQGLPPGMAAPTRAITARVMERALGARLPQVRYSGQAPEEDWNPLPFRPGWLNRRTVGRFSSLLDTAPLRETLANRLKIDATRIANSRTVLMICATNVETGRQTIFSNRFIPAREAPDQAHPDVIQGVTINRIVASCSIPMVYPWTREEDAQGSEAYYWDGAEVANTPLSPVLKAARALQDSENRAPDEELEAVVVMMTPWRDKGEDAKLHPRPQSFFEAVTVTLDWALLASFRETLKLTETFNALARQQREHPIPGMPQYRVVKVTVVAPPEFLPVTSILDYQPHAKGLIAQGYTAAAAAFAKQYPAG